MRIGSIFEDSRIPLPSLVPCLLAGVLQARRASQPSRFTARRAFRHKSALFLMHRIRFAMAADLAGHRSCAGIVEADETYVGGKPRDRARAAIATGARRGTPTPTRTPVFAAVERGGKVRAAADGARDRGDRRQRRSREWVEPVGGDPHRRVAASTTSSAMPWPGGHRDGEPRARRVRARRTSATNSVEGFFSLLKRGVYGTFHQRQQEAPAPLRAMSSPSVTTRGPWTTGSGPWRRSEARRGSASSAVLRALDPQESPCL